MSAIVSDVKNLIRRWFRPEKAIDWLAYNVANQIYSPVLTDPESRARPQALNISLGWDFLVTCSIRYCRL